MASRPTESDPQGADNAPSEFDDVFDAIASGEEPPAPAASDEPDPTGTDDGANDDPPPEGAGQDQGAAPQDGPAAQASDEVDWSALPEAARKAFERVQHEAKSQRGRVSALDRQLHHLRTQGSARPPEGGGDQGGKPKAPVIDEARLASFREEYPEMAWIADEMVNLRSTVASQSETVEQVRQRETEAYLQENERTLTEKMPDWLTWGQDERFDAWIATQPRHVQEAQARNAELITDADEALDVLTRFKAAHTPASPTTDPRRARQLGAGRDAATKQPPAASGVPDDFDAAFDIGAKQREQQRAGRR